MKRFYIVNRILLLSVCSALLFGACGKGDVDNDASQVSGSGKNAVSDTEQRMAYKDTRYFPEFTDTSKDYGAYETMSVGFAEDIYYLIRGERSESGYYISDRKVIAYSPDTGEEKVLLDEDDAGAEIITAALSKDGSVIVFCRTDAADSGYRSYKVDADGKEVFSREYTDLKIMEEGLALKMAADSLGRWALLAGQEIVCFDEKGSFTGKTVLEGKVIKNIACGNDGNIYAYELYTNQLIPINFETAGLGASSHRVPISMQNVMGMTSQADFLICDQTTVYRYGCENREPIPLFDLQDSQIVDASYIDTMGEMQDGRIFLFLKDEVQGKTEMAILTPKALAECPDVEVVTIGTAYPGRDLLETVADFNRKNEDIDMSILNYCVGGRNVREAADALMLDISIGKGPDICILDYLDGVQALLTGGFLADLTEFLESSQQFKREDFIEQTLDMYTCQDQVMAIPKCFVLQTIVGDPDIVGESAGWDMDDLKAVVWGHPDAMVFESRPSSYIFDVWCRNMLEEHVDVDRRKAKLDSAEFISFLDFMKELPDNFHENDSLLYGNAWLREGKALLSSREIGRMTDLQVLEAVFEGKYTCIGYPAPGKQPDCVIKGYDIYAISNASANKDSAWRFIEWSNALQGEETYPSAYRTGFPTRADVFEREMKEGVQQGLSGASFADGTRVEFREPTAEEVELVYSLIEMAGAEKEMEQTIVEIIKEEAAYMYEGNKTTEEVAKVIQNRVQLYLDES